MALLVALWGISSTFISIFNCTPVSAFWTRKGSCLDFKKFGIGYAIVNITTDFAVWLMPMPSVWAIQLPPSQKIALCLIFLLGLLLVTSMLVLDEQDVTWFYSTGFMWSVIEVSTGILCCQDAAVEDASCDSDAHGFDQIPPTRSSDTHISHDQALGGFGIGEVSWLVFRRQLKRWQAFRKRQIDNRGLEDDDGGFPAFVETMKRLYAKDESTAELAQLEAGPSWLKSAWLEERRARRWQRRWQRERGCNGFSDYVDAVTRRLGRQGFTRPFQLQEDPNQAHPK
ncbi:galactose oxidase [Purpureocillium lavendulum]|uniref:Galactose oxidase n=1 Tax=Purpureocillium lavendulum TaxID=1247861 RepID=A0AB34FDP3_9HYPO|nr:galactose oxidase [Purpureocillium lavendulum]